MRCSGTLGFPALLARRHRKLGPDHASSGRGSIGSDAAYGPLAALSELFSARLRYSGTSFTTTRLLAEPSCLDRHQLLASTGTTLAISIYLAIMAVVSFVGLAFSEVYFGGPRFLRGCELWQDELVFEAQEATG